MKENAYSDGNKAIKKYKTRIHWVDWRIVGKQLDIMPTYHYVQNQGKLMMQSRKNGQKPQFGQIFGRFRGQISPHFSEK